MTGNQPMFDTLRSLLDNPAFKSQVTHATIKLEANQHLLRQGEKHSNIFIIISGKVRVAVSGMEDTSKNVHPGITELGPENIFGEFSLFDDSPASADIITMSETELIKIDTQSFKVFLETNQEVGYKIFMEMLKALVGRLRQADKTILNLYAWGIKAHQIDKHLE